MWMLYVLCVETGCEHLKSVDTLVMYMFASRLLV